MSVTIVGGTKIEWADFTFNPWQGCEKISPACAHCYAETQAARFTQGLWGAGHGFRFPSEPYWRKPLTWARTAPQRLGRRPRVFCASMADIFEERDELNQHRERLFTLIGETMDLDWLVLTKRPEFADQWLGMYFGDLFPPNLWLGVSIENARFTWRADVLREIPAAVRFISAEPLLGSLLPDDPMLWGPRGSYPGWFGPLDLTGINWLIAGGESGPRARPMDVEWVRELLRSCRDHDVAPFVKQLGRRPVETRTPVRPLLLNDAKGGDWDEWPADLRVREFPR